MSEEPQNKKWKEEYKALQRRLKEAEELLLDIQDHDKWEGLKSIYLTTKLALYLNQRARIYKIYYPPTTDPTLKMDRAKGQARDFIEQYVELCDLHEMVLSGCSHVRPVIGFTEEHKKQHKESLMKKLNFTPISFD